MNILFAENINVLFFSKINIYYINHYVSVNINMLIYAYLKSLCAEPQTKKWFDYQTEYKHSLVFIKFEQTDIHSLTTNIKENYYLNSPCNLHLENNARFPF